MKRLMNAGLLQLLGVQRNENELFLEPGPQHTNAFGTVHQAVLSTLAEGAGWLALGGETSGDLVIPIALTSNFVGPTVLENTLTTKTEIVRRGRTQGVALCYVYQFDIVVAVFTLAVVIQRPKLTDPT